MKYLEKSFTLPANSRPMTDEEWEAIWTPAPRFLDYKSYPNLVVTAEPITPPATGSKHPVVDTVAPGEYVRVRTDGDYPFLGSFDKAGNLTAAHCPNCHCKPTSYRHIETCVTPGESD